MAARARGRYDCHKRCRRTEFNAQWYDYMYGVRGKIRFGQGRLHDGVLAVPLDDHAKASLEIWKINHGMY